MLGESANLKGAGKGKSAREAPSAGGLICGRAHLRAALSAGETRAGRGRKASERRIRHYAQVQFANAFRKRLLQTPIAGVLLSVEAAGTAPEARKRISRQAESANQKGRCELHTALPSRNIGSPAIPRENYAA